MRKLNIAHVRIVSPFTHPFLFFFGPFEFDILTFSSYPWRIPLNLHSPLKTFIKYGFTPEKYGFNLLKGEFSLFTSEDFNEN